MAASSLIRPSLGLSRPAQSTFTLLAIRYSPTATTAALRPPQTRPPQRQQQTTPFSSSPAHQKRRRYKTRDRSRLRGVSTIRRTGPKEFLSVSNTPLPVPARELPPIEVDADHGLWDFFYDKKLLQTPTEDADHGRAWMAEELRLKSWEDLHALWWVCVKERNRIATATHARKEQLIGFGRHEADGRDEQIKITMRRIKHVLTERQYAWEDAVELAKSDPEIDLSGEGPVFTPSDYLEEEPYEELEEEAASSSEGEESKLQEGGPESSPRTPDELPTDSPPTRPTQEQPRV